MRPSTFDQPDDWLWFTDVVRRFDRIFISIELPYFERVLYISTEFLFRVPISSPYFDRVLQINRISEPDRNLPSLCTIFALPHNLVRIAHVTGRGSRLELWHACDSYQESWSQSFVNILWIYGFHSLTESCIQSLTSRILQNPTSRRFSLSSSPNLPKNLEVKII